MKLFLSRKKYPELKFGKTIIVYDDNDKNLIKRTYEVEEGIKNGYEVIYTQNIIKVINLWKNGIKIKAIFKNKNRFNIKKFVLPEFRIEGNRFTISNQYKNYLYRQKDNKTKIVLFSSDYEMLEGIELILFLINSKDKGVTRGTFMGALWERWGDNYSSLPIIRK